MPIRSSLIMALLAVLANTAAAQSTPFDVIERAYHPYMTADDPFSFPMKVRSVASNPYKFWRGSKDIFNLWMKDHCADWLADADSFQPTHGDLHFGNIGAYPSSDGWSKLSFGMVDFDDSARAPFEFELLQGLITLHLTAEYRSIAFDADLQKSVRTALLDAYRKALDSHKNATDELKDDEIVRELLDHSKGEYKKELKDLTDSGKFRTAIRNDNGKLKDILRSADAEADALCAGIAQAIEHSPELGELMQYKSREKVRQNFKAAALRTRIGSSGSQGLRKLLVLLDHPFKDVDSDGILYLKEVIPSAAERSGIVPLDPRPAGQRLKEDMDRLTDPRPLANSWCVIGQKSYWVTIKEPWSGELDPDTVKTPADLIHLAKIWGTVAGSAHRKAGRADVILAKLTPALEESLVSRSDEFLKQLDKDFSAFTSDERTKALVNIAEDAIKDASK